MSKDLLAILAGYLLGSIPFAFIVTWLWTGKDIRVEGEGNVGARNVAHVAGNLAGLLVLLLDMAKGAAAYSVAESWTSGKLAFYLTAFALMLGHGFPIWLRGRGGKGLAPASGFLLQMWPCSVLAALLIFLAASRVIVGFNLAFGVAGAAFPFLTLLEGNDLEGFGFIVVFLSLAGVKKLIDLPYERAMRERSGWIEGPAHLRWTRQKGGN